jgi:hypothetical protein
MIELISITLLILLGVSLYVNETTLHKDKIKFDLLKDRKTKENK